MKATTLNGVAIWSRIDEKWLSEMAVSVMGGAPLPCVQGRDRTPHPLSDSSLPTFAACACAAAMVHDAADTESETEAVQEAATVPESSGFGAENDVAPRWGP